MIDTETGPASDRPLTAAEFVLVEILFEAKSSLSPTEISARSGGMLSVSTAARLLRGLGRDRLVERTGVRPGYYAPRDDLFDIWTSYRRGFRT